MTEQEKGAPTVEERLALAREAKEKREIEAIAAAKVRELEALELEEQFSKSHGTRGVDFDLLTTSEGTVVLELGPALIFKRLRAKLIERDAIDDESAQQFVQPCVVHPPIPEFLRMVNKRPGILVSLTDVLTSLYMAKEKDIRGK
jgi:hypothetical protein